MLININRIIFLTSFHNNKIRYKNSLFIFIVRVYDARMSCNIILSRSGIKYNIILVLKLNVLTFANLSYTKYTIKYYTIIILL